MRIILLTILALAGCDDAGSTPCDPETEVCCDAPEPEDIVCPEGSEKIVTEDETSLTVTCHNGVQPVGVGLQVIGANTYHLNYIEAENRYEHETFCRGDLVVLRFQQSESRSSTRCHNICLLEEGETFYNASCNEAPPCPPQP